MFKHWTLGFSFVLLLFLSSVAVATSSAASKKSPADSSLNSVTHDQVKRPLLFNFRWLYLEPTGGTADFASVRSNPGAPGAASFDEIDTDPDHESGLQILAHYYLDARDVITASYTYYDHSFTRSVFAPGNVLPLDVGGFSGVVSNSAIGTSTYDYRAYELYIGRILAWGKRLTGQIYAGLRYVDLQASSTADYQITATNNLLQHGNKSSFDGIGPLIGVLATFNANTRFALLCQTSVGLLDGDHNLSAFGVNPSSTTYIRAFNNTTDKNTVVPFVDMNVAAQYKMVIKHLPVALQLGYMIIYYNDIYKRGAAGPDDGRVTAQNSVEFRGGFLSLIVPV